MRHLHIGDPLSVWSAQYCSFEVKYPESIADLPVGENPISDFGPPSKAPAANHEIQAVLNEEAPNGSGP